MTKYLIRYDIRYEKICHIWFLAFYHISSFQVVLFRLHNMQISKFVTIMLKIELKNNRVPANTQRWFNVDICWNNVATSVNVISTLIQRRFVNVDTSTYFNVETTLIWVDSKNNFVLISSCLKNENLPIIVEKITVFQRRNNVSLSTLNQRRNLTLKQRWFWVDSKKAILLLYYVLI